MSPAGVTKRRQSNTQPPHGSNQKSEEPSHIRRENLKKTIIHLYGEEIGKAIKTFEKLRCKKGRLLCQLAFLLRCRDHAVIPTSLRVKHQNNTQKTRRILTQAGHALVKAAIQEVRKHLDQVGRHLLQVHLHLGKTLSREHFNKIDTITSDSARTHEDTKKQQHIRKFTKLLNTNTQKNVNTGGKEKIIYNLTDIQIDTHMETALSKGFNFAVTPSSVPKEDIICKVETALNHLEEDTAEIVRQEVARILRNAKPPTPNITPKEIKSLRNIRNNKEIIVLPADKGNATVIMKTEDYHNKLQNLLKDTAYSVTPRDPTWRRKPEH
jgi:competence protein ComGF